jgi:hypothetical protein
MGGVQLRPSLGLRVMGASSKASEAKRDVSVVVGDVGAIFGVIVDGDAAIPCRDQKHFALTASLSADALVGSWPEPNGRGLFDFQTPFD